MIDFNLPKSPSGIEGFDNIASGGLPTGRSTLISGTAGAGKTIFGLQFLVAGLQQFDEPGVLVTFEEEPEDMIRNVRGLDWDLQEMIDQGKMAIVDASPEPGESMVTIGSYDLSALLARIEHAVTKVKAKRIVLDALGSLFIRFKDLGVIRREIHRIIRGLRHMGVTSVLTMGRVEEYGTLSRYGVEEFVADNVIILRNQLFQEKRRRTIEILKFRGTTHMTGEYPFAINGDSGITIIPLSALKLTQSSSDVRISSGNPKLDDMCHGGLFRDSIILVSGATGTGKTLMVTEFMKEVIKSQERALLFAYEESREQLIRNAAAWGVDLESAEKQGLLKMICRYPESRALEDHLIEIKNELEEFKPKRIALDSLSALERVSTPKSFREFVIGITSKVKSMEVAGMFTNTTSMLLGGESITETHISTITDAIILLRYIELHGEVHRGITVLKMRGSWHDKRIHEYIVNDSGMKIRKPYVGIQGILSGEVRYTPRTERELLKEMFTESLDAP